MTKHEDRDAIYVKRQLLGNPTRIHEHHGQSERKAIERRQIRRSLP